MPTIARTSLSAIVAAALLTAGCGSGSDLGSAATTPTATAAVHVVLKTLEFNPTSVDAKVGQRVTWLNEDSSPHNVTYVSGPRFTSSRTLAPDGGRFSVTVTQPGTIHYYCTLHPWMKATIVVSR